MYLDGDATSMDVRATLACVDDLRDTNRRILAMREDLLAVMTAKKASWDGDSMTVFNIVDKKWGVAMDRMNMLLENSCRSLENAAALVVATDQKAANNLGT